MNESISRAAGTLHGQETSPDYMEELIRSIGRTPRQRTTLYGDVDNTIHLRGLERTASGGTCEHTRKKIRTHSNPRIGEKPSPLGSFTSLSNELETPSGTRNTTVYTRASRLRIGSFCVASA